MATDKPSEQPSADSDSEPPEVGPAFGGEVFIVSLRAVKARPPDFDAARAAAARMPREQIEPMVGDTDLGLCKGDGLALEISRTALREMVDRVAGYYAGDGGVAREEFDDEVVISAGGISYGGYPNPESGDLDIFYRSGLHRIAGFLD